MSLPKGKQVYGRFLMTQNIFWADKFHEQSYTSQEYLKLDFTL